MLPTSRLAHLLLLLAAAAACVPAVSLAQSPVQPERVAASFVLALGRPPTPAEIEQWAKPEEAPLADLMARHRRDIEGSAAQRSVFLRAIEDAFGREPTDEELRGATGGGLYFELMQRYLKRLAEQPAEYTQVVRRAYRLVLQREAYDVEIDYWARQPVTSFALLAGCLDDWARRNQPGLTATGGVASASVNSRYLAVARLSPAVAFEARAFTGLVPAGDRALAAAVGRTIVAPGAGHIASVGGIPFAAAGGTALRAEAPANPRL